MHGELAKLGISISQAAVSKYMVYGRDRREMNDAQSGPSTCPRVHRKLHTALFTDEKDFHLLGDHRVFEPGEKASDQRGDTDEDGDRST